MLGHYHPKNPVLRQSKTENPQNRNPRDHPKPSNQRNNKSKGINLKKPIANHGRKGSAKPKEASWVA